MQPSSKIDPVERLYGQRYLEKGADRKFAQWLAIDLPYLDFDATTDAYRQIEQSGALSWNDRALWGCNDRFYLLTVILGRQDATHPWLFARCREVEAEPDGYLDLWARYHYKSKIGNFAGIIQEIVRNPNITICILSATRDIARAFLVQIQQELEYNEELKLTFRDVFFADPAKESPRWSRDNCSLRLLA